MAGGHLGGGRRRESWGSSGSWGLAKPCSGGSLAVPGGGPPRLGGSAQLGKRVLGSGRGGTRAGALAWGENSPSWTVRSATLRAEMATLGQGMGAVLGGLYRATLPVLATPRSVAPDDP